MSPHGLKWLFQFDIRIRNREKFVIFQKERHAFLRPAPFQNDEPGNGEGPRSEVASLLVFIEFPPKPGRHVLQNIVHGIPILGQRVDEPLNAFFVGNKEFGESFTALEWHQFSHLS